MRLLPLTIAIALFTFERRPELDTIPPSTPSVTRGTILIDFDRIERGDTLSAPTTPLPAEPQQVAAPRMKMPERRIDIPVPRI
jgi:hypothetical protein